MKLRVVDEQCRGCEACLLACSLLHEHESNPALARLRVTKNMVRYTFHITVCSQCDGAACQAACPSGAITADARSVLRIDADNCLLCGACAEACPDGIITLNPVSGQYAKCDLCPDLAAPACITICPVEALVLEGGRVL